MAVQVQASINSGAWASGGLFAAFGDTLDLRAAPPAAGIESYTWELYDYPLGLTLPAGWINVSGIYTSFAANPAQITLPVSAANTWGKYAIRLRANGNPLQYDPTTGALNPSYDSALTDTATMVCIPSPVKGLHGLAFDESTQFDTQRGWVGEWMHDLRLLD